MVTSGPTRQCSHRYHLTIAKRASLGPRVPTSWLWHSKATRAWTKFLRRLHLRLLLLFRGMKQDCRRLLFRHLRSRRRLGARAQWDTATQRTSAQTCHLRRCNKASTKAGSCKYPTSLNKHTISTCTHYIHIIISEHPVMTFTIHNFIHTSSILIKVPATTETNFDMVN
jgi:hypothetical protein